MHQDFLGITPYVILACQLGKIRGHKGAHSMESRSDQNPPVTGRSRAGRIESFRLGILLFLALSGFPAFLSALFAADNTVQDNVAVITHKTVENAVTTAVEKTLAITAAKAEKEAAAQAALTAKRPGERKGSTTVHFVVFVVDIDNIDDADQSFTANVYIRLRWQDNRLMDPKGTMRQIPLSEVWNPRVLLANQTGIVTKSLPEIVTVSPDGTVIYHQRYTGKLSQPLDLSRFPMDQHVFTIQFVAVGYDVDELEFLPDTRKNITGGGIASTLSVPDWKLLKHEVLPLPYQPIEEIKAAGFAFRFEAKRYVGYYLFQVIFPLAVVVVMSLASFWIGREHVGIRIGVATSAILTLIAHRFVLASLLPRLPYMTHLDYFTVGSTVLVFLALILVVLVSFLAAENHDVEAGRIDLAARISFPLGLLLLFGWFILG